MLRLILLLIPTLLFGFSEEMQEFWDEEGENLFWESAAAGSAEEIESEPDLFEWPSNPFFTIELPLKKISSLMPGEILHCEGEIGGLKVDLAISCAFFHKLRFTSVELKENRVDLLHHLAELLPPNGRELGLLTYLNGIRTPLSLFLDSCRAIAKRVPEGTLFIGMHNKSKGLVRDVLRMLKEVAYLDTPAILKTRRFLREIGSKIHAINPNLLWGCILHSEAGALARRAIEGLNPEERVLLQNHLYLFAMTPVLPIPANYAYYSVNLYSRRDFLSVGGYLFGIGGRSLANLLFNAHNCRMHFIPCSSKWNERTFFFIDHSFLGSTYLHALEEQIERWRIRYGLYDGR